MKKLNKFMSVAMSAAMVMSLAACGSAAEEPAAAADTATETKTEEAAGTASTEASAVDSDKVYQIGILQQLEHPALDAASEGFEAALTELLGADHVKFDLQNAQGEQANCATISNNFVAGNYDLILANATTALQCAGAATSTIPILGTSITDYATALEIDDWTGATGRNISGTSDLAPIAEQEKMLVELFRMPRQLVFCTVQQNLIPSIRLQSSRKHWMQTIFLIKNIPQLIPMILHLSYRQRLQK